MKRELTVVIFGLFTSGMFVDVQGKIEVSVMERDSVTLKSGVSNIKTDDEIEWMFKNNKIATISSSGISAWFTPDESFRDRLQLDKQTGDFKISNIRFTDSGLYKLDISSPDGSSEVEFTVNVSAAKNNTVVSELEGESVSLCADFTYSKSYEVIQWWFGERKSLIAEISRSDEKPRLFDGPDERFRGRLNLDKHTGDLTIKDIRRNQSGLYEADITSTSSRYTVHHTQSFSVTVSDEVMSVSVREGDTVTLHTGHTEIQTDDQILWKFGDHEHIADLNGPLEKKWSNIQQNHTTGDLTIRDIKNDQYGYYKVKIKTTIRILHRKYRITDAVVSVMVGDSVTLHIHLHIIENKHTVLWYDNHDTHIKDATRNLTIRNIQSDQSGEYKVQIQNSSGTVSRRIFHINVSGVFSSEGDGVKTMSVVNKESFTLHSKVTDIQSYVLIEWRFGPQHLIIAKTDGKSNQTFYSNDEIFRNRLDLRNQTGDLSINSSITEHSGLYELKIINSAYTIQKSIKVTVNVSDPRPGVSPAAVAGIVVGVLVAAAAAGWIFFHSKKSRQKHLRVPQQSSQLLEENGGNRKDQNTEDPDGEEMHCTNP